MYWILCHPILPGKLTEKYYLEKYTMYLDSLVEWHLIRETVKFYCIYSRFWCCKWPIVVYDSIKVSFTFCTEQIEHRSSINHYIRVVGYSGSKSIEKLLLQTLRCILHSEHTYGVQSTNSYWNVLPIWKNSITNFCDDTRK